MRPGSRDTVPTVEEAVTAAARAVDPDGHNDGVLALVRSFEGDERPATAPPDLIGELRDTASAIDPERIQPAVATAAAAASWIATNPSSAEEPETAIRRGLRLFFADDVPREVADWLATRDLG